LAFIINGKGLRMRASGESHNLLQTNVLYNIHNIIRFMSGGWSCVWESAIPVYDVLTVSHCLCMYTLSVLLVLLLVSRGPSGCQEALFSFHLTPLQSQDI